MRKRSRNGKKRFPFAKKHSYFRILIIMNIVYLELIFEIVFPYLNKLYNFFFFEVASKGFLLRLARIEKINNVIDATFGQKKKGKYVTFSHFRRFSFGHVK